MCRIQLHCVEYAYAGGPSLFKDLNLDLVPGITAVTGPNGSGKSTLLRLVAGELEPTRGVIHRVADAIRRVQQSPDAPPPAVVQLAERYDKEAWALRSRYALLEAPVERWGRLSPGERQRWQLAALAPRADALLLDEPTNHLDADGRRALRDRLRAATGIVLLVTHDRDLIDATAERVLWLEGGRARLSAGGYDGARALQQAEREMAVAERVALRREQRRLQGEQQRRLQAVSSSDARLSAKRRMKSQRDSDGRSVSARARVENAAAKHGSAAGALGTRLYRVEEALEQSDVSRALGVTLTTEGARAERRVLYREHLGPIRFGGREVVRQRELSIGRAERLRIVGSNGSGKSTLLRAIISSWPTDGLTSLPQELTTTERSAVRERLDAMVPEARGRVLTRLAALGVPPSAVLNSACPSPGEARKLILARGLEERSEALALDEPENHFDASALDRLEGLLEDYPGAILLITHDERLARSIGVNRILTP